MPQYKSKIIEKVAKAIALQRSKDRGHIPCDVEYRTYWKAAIAALNVVNDELTDTE